MMSNLIPFSINDVLEFIIFYIEKVSVLFILIKC